MCISRLLKKFTLYVTTNNVLPFVHLFTAPAVYIYIYVQVNCFDYISYHICADEMTMAGAGEGDHSGELAASVEGKEVTIQYFIIQYNSVILYIYCGS